ncbi:MAG: serine/threonine-protein phosphatase [Synergistaceae bacterium]|nr:serine/threonine-protein phosphatase [Synergistaceae bacterium]
MSVQVKFAARSDVGHVRTNNEDNLYCNGIIMTVSERERPFFLSGIAEAPCIFAVFDGMGGEDCGELASLTAAQTLSEHSPKILRNILDPDDGECNFVTDANEQLLDIMRKQRLRMGTTFVMSVIGGASFRVYNLGDSRGFRVENGRLVRVTDDHTVAEEKVRMGLLTPEQADKSRERHILTRCLGIYDDEVPVSPAVYGPFMFDSNSGGLMCSDGLTDMLEFKDIAGIMKNYPEPSDAVNALVEAALMRGGRDNVTCVVFRIMEGE